MMNKQAYALRKIGEEEETHQELPPDTYIPGMANLAGNAIGYDIVGALGGGALGALGGAGVGYLKGHEGRDQFRNVVVGGSIGQGVGGLGGLGYGVKKHFDEKRKQQELHKARMEQYRRNQR